ncbi:MAG: hypothetical protein IJ040_08365 [Lachnospiraceae bacterium]|nr:hypothetical protein [Lachnospiraceae bacterium]
MGFQLDDSGSNQKSPQSTDTFDNGGGFDNTSNYNQSSGSITDGKYYHAPTSSSAPTPPPAGKKKVQIPTIVFLIPVIIAIIVGLTFIPWGEKKAIDEYARMPRTEIEEQLGVTLTENPGFVNKLSIPNGETNGFQVYTTEKEDFGVIYYNGMQMGVCFDSTKYSLFGYKISDPEYKIFNEANTTSFKLTAEDGSTYPYTEYFSMIEDMSGGSSTAQYVAGTDGSLLVFVFNNTTNRVVNIIYYYDSKPLLKGTSSL